PTLNIGTFLGGGAYGQVYLAEWERRRVAIKKFPVAPDEVRQAAAIRQEIDILQRLSDRHIIQFYGITYHEGKLVLIMDHAEGGSLQGAIETGRVADWPTKRRIVQEIVRGLAYIHYKNVLHRDLKSLNVLLTSHMEVKLCDFGLAIIKVRSASRSTSSQKGTTRWMAPELFAAKPKYTTKSDIFALGVVMWELAANCTTPFQEQTDNATVVNIVRGGEREELPDDTPSDYRQCVERCWDQDSTKRPEAIEMVTKNPDPPINMDGLDGHGPTVHISLKGGLTSAMPPKNNANEINPVIAKPMDAIVALMKRANANDVDAQVELAAKYGKGEGVDLSDTEAFKWHLRAAELKSIEAQYQTGDCFRFGRGTAMNHPMAMLWLQKAAEKGHARAQNDLGWMYQNGLGVERDYGQAVSWYRKSANQGITTAQENLAWTYQHGHGVERSYELALTWYRKSAEQGSLVAQNALGWMHQNGFGVERDYRQAVSWYRLSADQGNALAQNNLGWMYRNGQGVERDYGQAVSWYCRSADQGNASAQCSLGEMYLNGQGVSKDTKIAIQWMRKAAAQGHFSAMEQLGNLE
ncbi:hypothetical protein BGZ73_006285, partial [Actinomortierella ambigua]